MFARKGDEPGAGRTGAHRIRKKGDGASHSATRPLAQLNPARTAQATAAFVARILLDKARSLGIAVDINGDELLALMPARLPLSTRQWFEIWLGNFGPEIVDLIRGGRA